MPGLDHAHEHLGLARRRADRGDDLRAAHLTHPSFDRQHAKHPTEPVADQRSAPRPSSEGAISDQHVTVSAQPPALAQVADQVPVQRRDVRAARLGVRAAEREVHGAGDLLVEQRRAGGAVDAGVGPDPELAEEARAGDRWRAPPGGTRRRRSAWAATTSPSLNVSSTSATSTPRPLEGTSNRIVPLAERSSGPVNTSPLGMLRRPSELIQVRPATLSRRSVPVGLDPDLARGERAARSAAPGAR